jgi:hypothetical protein
MRDDRAPEKKVGGRQRPIAFLLIGVLIAGACFGCTAIKDTAKGTARVISDSTRKATDALTPGGSGLKHLLVVIGMEAPAEVGRSGFGTKFAKAFSEFLYQQCHELLLDEAMGELMKFPPRLASGQIDGFSLAMIGRPRGINFFVIGSLSDVRLESEKTGFWLWKDTRYKLRATLRVEIVDTTTGSKALDESFWEEMIVEEMKYEELEAAGTIPLTEMVPLFDRLLEEAGQKTCAVLRAQPWRGFITAANQNRLTLSAGRAAGLSEGGLLEVFDRGRVVESKDGQRFLLPGEKIGEARIQSLSASQSEAILSQSVPVGAGATVRLK